MKAVQTILALRSVALEWRSVSAATLPAVAVGLLLATVPSGAAAAPPPRPPAPPFKWTVAKIDHGLQPEGGTFRIAFDLVKPPPPKGAAELPAATVTLAPSFGDGWGRT